ncbi:hypothetical protein BGW36DRAFT_464744 [Talaromyces proteolyticus]|uniref:Mid2 domain-containing protein n=1 Tax=Talaromyces proteolyticus TaxID=1131652 RepID=A0AAD4PSX2_9EURO|nr:uncharacterized protein BGW36DRAFT_464744 [Talaromyces proteolyticus]KAH8692201.1 hypothetical protein BGW36DRAFT_464744 [Talaromyces proteolyticus]
MVGMNAFLAATNFIALSSTSLADNRACYYPDQSQALTDVPCGNGTEVACCGSGDICLSTGFCLSIEQQPYALSRKSCTDKNWGVNCPNYCLQESSYNLTWVSVVLYSFLENVSQYCCNNIVDSGGSAVCLNNLPTFTMPNAEIVPDTNLLAGYAKDNSSSTATNNTESSCNATISASSMPPQNSSAAADRNSNSSDHGVAIGAGVGIPLGLIALASIGWALRERRRFHAAVVGARPQSTQGYKMADSNNNIYKDNNNSSHTQHTQLVSSQYGGYPNNGGATSTSTYRQPQSRLTEMESTALVELDNARTG